MTHRNTAKAFERRGAIVLTRALGAECKRMPLSGQNSGHGPGDAIVPEGFDLLVEDKLRAKFQHHTMYKDAVKQAREHNIANVLLFTQKKYENGFLVTMNSDLFEAILCVPGVRELLRKEVIDGG